MPCTRPIQVMLPHTGATTVPCGQCIQCRINHSRQWATRVMHEASMHDNNCYCTLTYGEEEYEKLDRGSLNKKHLSAFVKRLRERERRKNKNDKIKFFGAGEYGDEKKRAHYHICLCGYDPNDRKFLGRSKSRNNLYYSRELSDIWNMGHIYVQELTFESAQYVAKYCIKNLNGEMAEIEYEDRIKPFGLMSRNPGIGRSWYDKYKMDVYRSDRVVIRGDVICRSPRYYDNCYAAEEPEDMERIRKNRKEEHTEIGYNGLINLEAAARIGMEIKKRKGEFENGCS